MNARDAENNESGIVERLRKIIPDPEKISDNESAAKAGAMVISLMCSLESCLDGVGVGRMVSRALPEVWNFGAVEQDRLLSMLSRDEFMELLQTSIRGTLASNGVSLGFEGIEVFDISVDWEGKEVRFEGLAEPKKRSIAWMVGPCRAAWEVWALEVGVDMNELEVVLGVARKAEKSYMEPRHGDKVRLRVPSGNGPKYGWGSVKNGEVGFVSRIDKDDMTVDFPSQCGWTGSREELVLESSSIFETNQLRAGSRVRLNPNIEDSFSGRFPWPSKNRDSIGVVNAIDQDDLTISVIFPNEDSPTWVRMGLALSVGVTDQKNSVEEE